MITKIIDLCGIDIQEDEENQLPQGTYNALLDIHYDVCVLQHLVMDGVIYNDVIVQPLRNESSIKIDAYTKTLTIYPDDTCDIDVLTAYVGKIKDPESDARMDFGSSDISINKNFNIGSSANPKNLYVSGKITSDFNNEGEIDFTHPDATGISVTIAQINKVFLKDGLVEIHADISITNNGEETITNVAFANAVPLFAVPLHATHREIYDTNANLRAMDINSTGTIRFWSLSLAAGQTMPIRFTALYFIN